VSGIPKLFQKIVEVRSHTAGNIRKQLFIFEILRYFSRHLVLLLEQIVFLVASLIFLIKYQCNRIFLPLSVTHHALATNNDHGL